MKKITIMACMALITAGCMRNDEDRALRRHMHNLTREQKACVERQGCHGMARTDREKKRECLRRAFRACGAPMPGREPAAAAVVAAKEDTCG